MASRDISALAFALGELTGAMHFAGDDLRRAAALATIADAWKTYRRDAGAGDAGPAHVPSISADTLLFTCDPRRDAVLLWLADHGTRPIAAAAAMVALMVGASHRFDAAEMALLNAAQAALAGDPADACGPLARALGFPRLAEDHPVYAMKSVVGAIDALSRDPAFAEGQGHDIELQLPGGSLRHFVTAEPSGTWALNLALLGRPPHPFPALTGIVARVVFKIGLEVEERAAALIASWSHVAALFLCELQRIERALARGGQALAGLSRNARAIDTWALAAALGPITRAQTVRALGLSRAGGDLMARTLATTGLVRLEHGGRIVPANRASPDRSLERLDQISLGTAVTAIDKSMAEIDRLLARMAT